MKSILRNFKILFNSRKLQIQETNLILYYRILRISKWEKITETTPKSAPTLKDLLKKNVWTPSNLIST